MNPHSNLASFYRHFYLTSELPNNLCSYFWSLVFAFIIFPFVWLAMLSNYVNKKVTLNTNVHGNTYYAVAHTIQTGVGLLFSFIAIVIGGFTFKVIFSLRLQDSLILFNQTTSITLAVFSIYLHGILTMAVLIGLFYLVMFLVRLIPKREVKEETWEEANLRREKDSIAYHKREYEKINNPSFLRLTWRWLVAFKEKNCPLITWDYSKKD